MPPGMVPLTVPDPALLVTNTHATLRVGIWKETVTTQER